MYCPKCKARLIPKKPFCHKCGYKASPKIKAQRVREIRGSNYAKAIKIFTVASLFLVLGWLITYLFRQLFPLVPITSRAIPKDYPIVLAVNTDSESSLFRGTEDKINNWLVKESGGALKYQEDFKDWQKEITFSAKPDGQWIIVVAISDNQGFSASEKKFIDLLEERNNVIDKSDYLGYGISTINEESSYAKIEGRMQDDLLIIGSGKEEVESALAAYKNKSKSIAGNQAYKKLSKDIPSKYLAYGFVDYQGLIDQSSQESLFVKAMFNQFPATSVDAINCVFKEDENNKIRFNARVYKEDRKENRHEMSKEVSDDLIPGNAFSLFKGADIADDVQRVRENNSYLFVQFSYLFEKISGVKLEEITNLASGPYAVSVGDTDPKEQTTLILKLKNQDNSQDKLEEIRRTMEEKKSVSEKEYMRFSEKAVGETKVYWTDVEGSEIAYSVFRNNLIFSSSPEAIEKIINQSSPLSTKDKFRDVSENATSFEWTFYLDFEKFITSLGIYGLNLDLNYFPLDALWASVSDSKAEGTILAK